MVEIEASGLLFDMDGVLISSIGSVVRCWRQWAKEFEVPGWESFEIPHGMRAVEIIRSAGVDAGEGLRRIEDLELADLEDLRVLPGARALLESLPAERWAIVTSATRRLMLGRLAAVGLPAPSRIVAADDVVKGKPDPEPYRRGAELIGLNPTTCVVVEDAPSGARAGVAAGCRVLGVLGTHGAGELRAAGARWETRSLAGVRLVEAGAMLKLEVETAG